METISKHVRFSDNFYQDLRDLVLYGTNTFGKVQAEKYEEHIYILTSALSFLYDIYPECRHLATKNHIYRNIILQSHLIVYRITPHQIEVLRILHSHSSISKIRSSRGIKF